MSVRVKVCGVTSVTDAKLVVQSGADLIGLNFYPSSPRYVSDHTAREIRAVLPPQMWCVGVFVNADRQEIRARVKELGLHAIQFHGDEAEEELRNWDRTIIKAVRVRAGGPRQDWEQSPADYLLLDTYLPGRYGGTGETFAWGQIAGYPRAVLDRVILAGGLSPENVAAAVRTVRPWAVDVASGVEAAPRKKDADKLRTFVAYAKTA